MSDDPIKDMTEGFVPIAVRDDLYGNTVVSYKTETREFLLSINGKLAGPMKLEEIRALRENLNDVLDMPRGKYLFIKEYTVRGQKVL